MKKFPLLIVALLLTGCVAAELPHPKTIEQSSKYDGEKQLRSNPAWVYQSDIKLSLLKTTRKEKDDIVLYVHILGMTDFRKGECLKFKIDGKEKSLAPIDGHSDYGTAAGHTQGLMIDQSSYTYTSRRFLIDRAFIKQLIDAREVLVRVELVNSKVADGVFSKDGPYTARQYFRAFYNKVGLYMEQATDI